MVVYLKSEFAMELCSIMFGYESKVFCWLAVCVRQIENRPNIKEYVFMMDIAHIVVRLAFGVYFTQIQMLSNFNR